MAETPSFFAIERMETPRFISATLISNGVISASFSKILVSVSSMLAPRKWFSQPIIYTHSNFYHSAQNPVGSGGYPIYTPGYGDLAISLIQEKMPC